MSFIINPYAFGGAVYNPASVANTEFYWEADFQALADNAAFTQLTDQSANGANATQATGTKQATNKTNILNGEPVARCDGGDTYNLTVPSATEFTISLLWTRNAGVAPVILKGADANDYIIGGTGFVTFRVAPGVDTNMTSSYETGYELHTWTYDGVTLKGYVNGVEGVSVARTIASYDPQWLFSFGDSSNYLTGDCCLIQYVSRDITGDDLNEFTAYALAKYGL